jgi:hypothetical protein
MLGDLMKATVGVVTAPIAIAADIVTVGGILTGKDGTYTGAQAEQVIDNLENATRPCRDDST